ncbi:hypothetical protein EJB05_55958, partial [Eragrostis curvula]
MLAADGHAVGPCHPRRRCRPRSGDRVRAREPSRCRVRAPRRRVQAVWNREREQRSRQCRRRRFDRVYLLAEVDGVAASRTARCRAWWRICCGASPRRAGSTGAWSPWRESPSTAAHAWATRCRWFRKNSSATSSVRAWTTEAELTETPLGHSAELVSHAVPRVDDCSLLPVFCRLSELRRRGGRAAGAVGGRGEDDAQPGRRGVQPSSATSIGSGAPFFHMRGYVAEEGLVVLVPSLFGDGSFYAYVKLFRRDMDVFKDCCYSLLAAADARL